MASSSRASASSFRSASRSASRFPPTILSFPEYKARFGHIRNIDKPVAYNPASEEPPDDHWYSLEHDQIGKSIHELCAPLLQVVRAYSPNDDEISSLSTALKTANVVPRGQKFYAAFLGEQGIGKSSIINAVLSRNLVNVSASSSACTAYPTIITYKDGAGNDTDESDVRVEYLVDDEIRDCALEQARRYRDAYPRRARQSQNEDAEEVLQVGLEDELSDDEDADDLAPSASSNDGPPIRTIRPSVLRGAKTAKKFFEIIFETCNSEARGKALQDDLDYLDIETATFADHCVAQAHRTLSRLSVQDGFSEYLTLKDTQLSDFQEELDRVWPLVKSVHLQTGHTLLENNVGILDLPGYGDDNHIRTALIDRFREMAHFEIVVAPTSRVVSSVVQDRYLNRSIRRLGADNTLLVTNKSDQLCTGIRNHINRIADDPFPQIKQNLTDAEEISKGGTEDKAFVRAYKDYLFKEARDAYIQREANIVRLSMQDKGVDILSISASEYQLCLGNEDDDEDEKPKLTPHATGLPQLRRYLFHLPAQTNFRTLHHHVFETLPDIAGHIQRILEKFEDDDRYAQMRENLHERLPFLRTSLEDLATSLPHEHAIGPFLEPEVKACINSGLSQFVQSLSSPALYYATFSKMLRENGIPTNGKGLGKNLNNEILQTMIEHVNNWHSLMQQETDGIAMNLDKPLQDILPKLKNDIQAYNGNFELKNRAGELLDTTIRRILMAYGKLVGLLTSKLRDIYLLYSTEVNVQCPVALEMKDVYQQIIKAQLAQPGKGSYSRQQAHLLRCLLTPDWPKQALPKALGTKILRAQVDSWSECCQQYVNEAMILLERFAQAMEDMCDNGQHLTSNHRRIREQIDSILPGFERQLDQIQRQFPGVESSVDSASGNRANSASNKRKSRDERAATQPPPRDFRASKRPKINTQSSSTRAMSIQPVVWLRERFLSRFDQPQGSGIKREPEI
ncbi:hypothetical protein E8E13_003719 [Curvularia kusanoi]|uniref:Dynamin N-terminal domain-containing protein n=1 Tax=Curvularia kusanoi TaxID=90978 RepID=A0A9P4T6P6_CURKU|nr:hypothetical protein E8E13_003719 [Curvularia kusanoi]